MLCRWGVSLLALALIKVIPEMSKTTDLARGGVAGEGVETEWWDRCTRGDCDCSLRVDRSVSDWDVVRRRSSLMLA